MRARARLQVGGGRSRILDEEITTGKVHTFTIAGEEVVAYRASNGELRVFVGTKPKGKGSSP